MKFGHNFVLSFQTFLKVIFKDPATNVFVQE
jgi:hypothetical protein